MWVRLTSGGAAVATHSAHRDSDSVFLPFVFLAHDRGWYEDESSALYGPLGSSQGRNVVDYYDALSRRQFTFILQAPSRCSTIEHSIFRALSSW